MNYSVAKVKNWEGHEGAGFQGELLRDGKVIGWFHQDGNGGEMRLDRKAAGTALRERVAQPLRVNLERAASGMLSAAVTPMPMSVHMFGLPVRIEATPEVGSGLRAPPRR